MAIAAMCVVDAAGLRIAENESWRALLGDGLDAPWRHVAFSEALAEVVGRSSAERSCPLSRPSPDGSREFVARMLAIPGSDQTMVTLADVTEFRTRERALQAEEQRIRRLWERLALATRTSQVGVWEYDAASSTVIVDETMCALYELSVRPTVRVDEIYARIHPDDLGGLMQHFEDIATTGREADWTYRVCLQSGGIRWLHVSAGMCSDVTGPRLVGTTIDVTRRRDEEERLRTLSLVAERTTDAVLVVRHGLVEWTNVAAERMLGGRNGELCGRELLPALAAPGADEREIGVRGRGSRWVSVDVQSLHPEDPTGARVVFVRDLTERRQLEAERRMSHKLDAVGQLAAGLAHEINTPVQYAGDTLAFVGDAWGSVTGFVGHLLSTAAEGPISAPELRRASEDYDLDYLVERMPSALVRMSEAMARIGQVVSTMREFGDPDRARIVQADLVQALSVALAVARPQVDPVADVVVRASPVPGVVCNLAQVHDLLHALLLNAADAIAARGDGQRGHVTLWTRHTDDQVEIGVEDDGCGMAPDVLARAFDPFFSTKPEGQGRGLGLTTARLVVVRHGGSIDVESRPGVGTCIRIRLPSVTDDREIA